MGIRVLNVAEKPSVAKAVAGILSRNQVIRTREGRSRYNKIFEFNYNIRGQNCVMLFTSVTGHLMELDFDDRFRKWHSCDPLHLYHAPVRKFVPEDKLDIKMTLEEEARQCQWLVLWLDCDREGENIAYEVIDVCTKANSRLDIWRARFSALIERDIHESVQALVRPNQYFADAVDVRQEIDLRIGASFTRFQTMLLRDAFVLDFAEERNVVLSYGPCQFPTLGFIVERYWEIQAHEDEEFWKINCTHNSEDEGIATFNWMRGHLFDYTCAVILYEMCVQESTANSTSTAGPLSYLGAAYRLKKSLSLKIIDTDEFQFLFAVLSPSLQVTKVTQQEKYKYPPYPLSTIELEKRASRYFRMSSEQTMKIAEDLYQNGFISYPRTETDSFSERTDLRAIVNEQQGHPLWGAYALRLLDPQSGLWRNPGSGGHDDKAHPPIHPTKFSPGERNWSQDHSKVYELVVRHFLACVSKPALGAETVVEIDIAGESFSTSGRVILEKNYLDVYRFETWGGSVIPTYTLGQQFIPTTLTLDSGVTRPPALLSEADLLTCMDKAGIGTDATMHDHIKKLLDRFYATKDANTRFSPTNLGQALVMGYDDMGYELWKPYLRAMMESDMKAVSAGTKSKAQVLEMCLEQMKNCFSDARVNKVKLFEAMEIFFERKSNSAGRDEQYGVGETVRRCGACREFDMVLKRMPGGNFMVGCMGYPQCRNVVWLPGSVSEATVTTNICATCTPSPVFMIQFQFKRLEIPVNYNSSHLGCVGGCDDILKQLIEICGTGSRSTSTTPTRGRNTSTTPARGRGQNTSTPRQSAYPQCGQFGHLSSNCPTLARGRSLANTAQQSGQTSVSCDICGVSLEARTANTENNRGRRFYSCQPCKFFTWEDNLGNNNGGGGRTSSRGRGGRNERGGRGGRGGETTMFVSATGDPVSAGRRCFICNDPSHFANVCPSRGGGGGF